MVAAIAWVECHRPNRRPWRLRFDGGMPETWPVLRRRIAALPPVDREIDLAVISHIDADHRARNDEGIGTSACVSTPSSWC